MARHRGHAGARCPNGTGFRCCQTPPLRRPMNSRQLTLILIVALVLGAIGWVFFHRGVRSWESRPISSNQKVMDFPLNDVAHITINDGSSDLNLIKKSEAWVVSERADYPA